MSSIDCSRLPPVIAAMCDPAFYPDRPRDLHLLQTHISYLLLAGERVYKVKKPVRFSFLDFSTLSARKQLCHEEVRLNRRLAAGVYLGVVGIASVDGQFRFCAEDDPQLHEVAVEMRRLPADRMLSALLDHGEVTAADLAAIAARLAGFYRTAETSAEISADGAPEKLRRLMRDDFEEMAPFRDSTIAAADDDAIQQFCFATLERIAPLLNRRREEGRVRDGHGDLHADNICLTMDGVVIFDCIEFNPAFRHRDIASDIAFLSMDLDYRRRFDLRTRLLRTLASELGDAEMEHLVPFFACHRAYIRGKVESLKSVEPEVGSEHQRAAAEAAKAYFALAYRLSWSYSTCLVVVMGLSGTGKSSVARALAQRVGAARFNSDDTRKRIAGLAPTSRSGKGDQQYLYSSALSARTYEEMLADAARELEAGRIAIVDATFLRREYREEARAHARRWGCPILFVECDAPAASVRERLGRRALADLDSSDADWSVYEQQLATYERPIGEGDVLRLDLGGTIENAIPTVERALRERVKPTI